MGSNAMDYLVNVENLPRIIIIRGEGSAPSPTESIEDTLRDNVTANPDPQSLELISRQRSFEDLVMGTARGIEKEAEEKIIIGVYQPLEDSINSMGGGKKWELSGSQDKDLKAHPLYKLVVAYIAKGILDTLGKEDKLTISLKKLQENSFCIKFIYPSNPAGGELACLNDARKINYIIGGDLSLKGLLKEETKYKKITVTLPLISKYPALSNGNRLTTINLPHY